MASHPLMLPDEWALMTGARAAGPLRQVAALLCAAAAIMMLAWVYALVADAYLGLTPHWLAVCALALGGIWAWLAWRTWRNWSACAQTLTLKWLGPVRDAQQGFLVEPWGVSAKPHVVLDLQRWMLVHLQALPPGAAAGRPGTLPQAWVWLAFPPSVMPEHKGHAASLHKLRTLLYLPDSVTVAQASQDPDAAGPSAQGAWSMASWANLFNPGFKLRRFVLPVRAVVGRSSRRGDQDTLFPPTQLLADVGGVRESADRRGRH
jgi:hypothetical protein